MVVRALSPPQVACPGFVGLGFDALCHAACADLLRRFADPVRIVDVGAVRIVSVLDAVVYVHDRATRHVSVGAWQPDGTVAINRVARFEIGRPLMGFVWLEIFSTQWQSAWQVFKPALDRQRVRNRLRNVLKRWLRETVNLRAQRKVFRDALLLDAQVVWMAERLVRNHRKAWLFADRYNAVGEQFERLRWALSDSPSAFRVVGLALIDGRVLDPDEPVASTLNSLRLLGVTSAAWRAACRLGPRLFDRIVDHAANSRLFDACTEMLRLIEHTDLEPLPAKLQDLIFWQHALPHSNYVQFEKNWCCLPPWFLRHATRAARAAEMRGELGEFLDLEFLPAVEWVSETRPAPDANQINAGWRWIVRTQRDWAADPLVRLNGRNPAWRSAIERESVEGLNIYALTDARTVIEEGQVMCHCVAQYVSMCVRGIYRLFSLRDGQTGERVATALLKRIEEEQWELVDVRLRRNETVEGAPRRAGLWLSQRYGEAVALQRKAA